MKHNKALLIAGGILASVAALAPMATYAASDSDTANVSVTVNPTITIDSTTDFSQTMTSSNIITGNISATITANKAYRISLSAAEPALKASGTTDTIPANANVAAGTNAWGIKKKGGTTNNDNNTNASAYTAITTSSVVFYNAPAGATGVKTDFAVGISIAPSLSAGTYATTVTVTAATV